MAKTKIKADGLPFEVRALEATGSDFDTFHRTTITRRPLGPHDVAIDIRYCGICHSDIAMVQIIDATGGRALVPGHEIAGVVAAVGSEVEGFAPGDRVGVGCFTDSCGHCEECEAGNEQFCEKGAVSVFTGDDYEGRPCYGGYSQSIVVKDKFVLRIPDVLGLAEAAPLLCAGVTTYSPLKRYSVDADSRVAVIGMGGLGHIAVQFAHAMGAQVTVLGHSESKRDEAVQLGADSYEILRDKADFARLANSFDFILNAATATLDLDRYLAMLRPHGVFCFVSLSMEEQRFNEMPMFAKEGTITVSNVGGIALTQEMLDFAAEHSVRPMIETIGIDEVPQAYRRVIDSDVHYRFVIDMATLDE